MKKTITLLFACLCLAGKAQTIQVSGEPIQFTKILKVDSTKTKDDLYSNGLEWFATNYKNSKYVLQMQDKDAGLILGKATISVLMGTRVEYVDYTIKMAFKNGRIKYDLSDFTNNSYGLIKDGEVVKANWMIKGMVKKQYAMIKKKSAEEVYMIASSIESSFSQKKKEDW